MEDTINIVSKPEINLQHYLNIVIDFFVSHYPSFFGTTKSFIGFLIGLSIPISILLFIGIIISVERLKVIRNKEDLIYNPRPKVEMAYDPTAVPNREIAERWDRALMHIESKNSNDWRQAIIDADIILGDLLTKMGYQGEGIGEQLKRVEKADFKTLNDAWEAHRVRNEIAHAGSDYSFNQHEARRVIHLYRKVFEEFYYI